MATTRKPPAMTKARGGSSRTPTIAAVATIVILAVVVFGGIFLFRGGSSGEPIAPSPVQASYTTTVQGGVIVAGNGPTRIDVYEDALCPACRQFESIYGQKFTDALDAGKVTVRYHMVNLLEQQSNPPGYSTLGGNALICAAENGAFASLHKTLYDRQPEEGGKGFTTDQLVAAGQAAGAGPGYAACVQDGTHAAAVAANYQQASSDPALQQRSGGSTGFGTPTVVVGGRMVQPGSPELAAALA